MPLRAWVTQLLDFCYPGQCAACGDGFDSGGDFCLHCETAAQQLADAPACDRCAMPLTEHGAPCPHCLGRGLSPFDRVVALGLFHDPLKSAIHHAKYSHRWTLAESLADRLLTQERVKSLLHETEVLIPVPLHHRRQVDRGYNQAEVIARRLGKESGIKVTTAADRVRDTETQTHLHSRARREENLRDAFVLVKPATVAGKHVVLVDDVMTTGATLVSFARAIRLGAPASISALVISVADPRGRGFEVI